MSRETDAADSSPDEPTAVGSGRTGGMDKRVVAGVAGIAVGSAAIAAALLFANRPAKGKVSPPPPPEPTLDARPQEPDASDIKIAN